MVQYYRAFLYVKDCVVGLTLAMEKAKDAKPINLGSEEVVTIRQLAEMIIKISGKNVRIEHDLSGPKGTYRYCADTKRMKEVLGFAPKTPLIEGLNGTYR